MKPGWRIRRLHDGSTALARRTGRAFVPLDEDGEVRLIASGFRITAGVALGNGALNLAHQSPIWLVGGTCAWCWAAWRAGSPEALLRGTPEKPGQDTEATEATETGNGSDFLALLHELMPAPGDRVHIAQVAAEWTGNPADTGPVREMCMALGINITRGVRVPGRQPAVSTGIHHAALPPLPDPFPAGRVAVVSAGQHGQQAEQQQQATARIVPDPSGDPHRWTVQWDDQKTA